MLFELTLLMHFSSSSSPHVMQTAGSAGTGSLAPPASRERPLAARSSLRSPRPCPTTRRSRRRGPGGISPPSPGFSRSSEPSPGAGWTRDRGLSPGLLQGSSTLGDAVRRHRGLGCCGGPRASARSASPRRLLRYRPRGAEGLCEGGPWPRRPSRSCLPFSLPAALFSAPSPRRKAAAACAQGTPAPRWRETRGDEGLGWVDAAAPIPAARSTQEGGGRIGDGTLEGIREEKRRGAAGPAPAPGPRGRLPGAARPPAPGALLTPPWQSPSLFHNRATRSAIQGLRHPPREGRELLPGVGLSLSSQTTSEVRELSSAESCGISSGSRTRR